MALLKEAHCLVHCREIDHKPTVGIINAETAEIELILICINKQAGEEKILSAKVVLIPALSCGVFSVGIFSGPRV